ncbi:exo-alpha-sialidase [Coprobacter sp.]
MKNIYLFFCFLFIGFFASVSAYSTPVNNLAFNGSNQCMRISSHNDFNIGLEESFTVSLWIKANSYVHGQRYISKRDLNIGDPGPSRAGYELWSGNSSSQCLAINTPKTTSSNILSVFSNKSVNSGTWFHAAIVINRNEQKIYMYHNGSIVGTSTATDMSEWSVTNDIDVYVGAGYATGISNYMNGAVANVRFYKKALSSDEISTDMGQNDFSALPESLKTSAVAAYDFANNNISGVKVTDLTGKGHDGTLLNFPIETANITNVTLTQNSKFTGRGNAQDIILKANIQLGGTGNSTPLNSVKINLDGTTDISDISTIKIYSTGSTDRFDERTAAGATLIGSFTPSEGDINCDLENAVLSSGNNYLWITATVSDNAIEGNNIDASFSALTTEKETFTVTNPSPTGYREILLTRKLVYAPGDNGSTNYRIPALVVAKDNSLVIATDKRKYNETDLPQDIDIVINRSEDGGRTWSEPVTIAQGTGVGHGFGDAALAHTTEENGLICVFVGGDGLWESTVQSGKKIKSYMCKSSDNGKTWSEPREITQYIYGTTCSDPSRQSWKASFFGSGNGLLTSTGRIMFVAAIREGYAQSLNNYVIYSDDNGDTWNISGKASTGGDEAKVVELTDGRILMSIRHGGARWYNISDDGGLTWNPTTSSWSEMQANACNGDIIRYTSVNDGYETNRLLHSVPNSTERRNVSVFVSYDEGETWSIKKSICPYQSVYSSLAILPDGTIGAYIEENPDGACSLYFMNFTLDWLTNGADTYMAPGTERTEVPVFTPADGTKFEEGSEGQISIECGTPNAKIYYTTDGSVPTTNSTLYERVITITEGTIFKAIAKAENMPQSIMVTASYEFPHYCTPEGTVTRTDRYLGSVSFSGGIESFNSGTINTASSRPLYVDMTSKVLKADAGATITPSLNWTGEWMHAYIFIDYNKDKDFTDENEIVSYSFYKENLTEGIQSGTNSLGQTVQNNGGVSTSNVPAFTLPADLAPGSYRLRVKIDWNSLDPCGASDIIANGGTITDFSLEIPGIPDGICKPHSNKTIKIFGEQNKIRFTEYSQPLSVEIFTMEGILVNKTILLDTSEISATKGHYLIRITDTKETSVHKVFVK